MLRAIEKFVRRWGREDAPAPHVVYAPAPGTEIRYSPSLVDELNNDHELFFSLLDEIVNTYTLGNSLAIPTLLKEFEALLNGHLITERVRLYAYMDAYFSRDAHTREMLREYRMEMDRIGDSVVKLLRKYRNIGVDEPLPESFHTDFGEMRQVLSERMRREETVLYPLYMPVSG